MESSRGKPGFNVVASSSRWSAVPSATDGGRPVDSCGAALRAFVAAAALLAAVLMGFDRETKTIQVAVVPTLPPMDVPVTAKWSYSSAFVYFVVANAMACVFSMVTLALLVLSRNRGVILPIVIGDLVMMALLFSAVGAAAEFGILGERGNSHVRWNKVCNVYGSFCERAMGAVIVSLIGAFVDLVIVMLTILDIHKGTYY